MEKFKIWSESNHDALSELSPDLGINDWSYLNMSQKLIMIKLFQDKGFFSSNNIILIHTIRRINELHKYNSYGINLLNHICAYSSRRMINRCCINEAWKDFLNIFQTCNQNVVYEMLSIYADQQIIYNILKDNETLQENDKQHRINSAYQNFDTFAEVFNDIFNSFGLNVVLTRSGLIPKQEVKITEEIYKPVIAVLSDPKWDAVNRDLSDAFQDYRLNTDQGYSSCITHTISALEAFLQIIVHNKTGKGVLSDLINEAVNKNLIPNDPFSKKIFDNSLSILMQERKSKSDSHPKKEYATEKHARLIMNLTMIFIQHCIQFQK